MTDSTKHNLPSVPSERLEAEALAWFAQLNGDEMTEKDLVAFREWISRSPAHVAEIKSIASLWGEMNALSFLQDDIHAADKVSKKLRRKDTRRKLAPRWAIAGIAASLLAFAGVNQVLLVDNQDIAPVQIAQVKVPVIFKSVIGEQQTHTLDDGSIITLNTDSYLEVDYSKSQRNVRLIKGEALFSVEHDPTRPFLVFAETGIVRAVGTEFSVRIEPDNTIDVAVSDGSVELSTISPTRSSDKGEIHKVAELKAVSSLGVIVAGQSAKIENYEAVVELKSMDEIKSKHAWKNGELEFRGERLNEVISEVGRYTDLNIIVADADINELRFGGLIKVGETELLFRTLEGQFGIKAEFSNDNKTVVLTKG